MLLLREQGFTLLEILVAVAVSTIVVMASYAVVQNVILFDKNNDSRAAELRDMLYLKRQMQHDLQSIRYDDKSPQIECEEKKLVLKCYGDAAWNMSQGYEVSVSYSWKQAENGGAREVFSRDVLDAEGNTITWAGWQSRGKIERVEYELLTEAEWERQIDCSSISPRGIKWKFFCENIGPWELIFAFP